MSEHGPIDAQIHEVRVADHGAQPDVPFAQGIVNQCMGIVADYKEGRKSKAQATRELVGVAEHEHARHEHVPRQELDEALEDYISMLADFDWERDAAIQGVRGARPNVERNQVDEERPDQGERPAIRGRAEDGDAEGPRKRQAIDTLLQFDVAQQPALPEDLQQTLNAV
jgi:hypothetical protein